MTTDSTELSGDSVSVAVDEYAGIASFMGNRK